MVATNEVESAEMGLAKAFRLRAALMDMQMELRKERHLGKLKVTNLGKMMERRKPHLIRLTEFYPQYPIHNTSIDVLAPCFLLIAT